MQVVVITMTKVEPWKKWAFVCSLALIALFINSRFAIQRKVEQQQQRQSEIARKAEQDEKKAAQEAAAKEEEHLRRYVNAGFSRKPGKKTFAFAAASRDGTFSSPLTTALVRRFNGDGVEIYSSFFTPDFVSDGLFQSVFNGSTDPVKKLKLADSVDGLLLAYEQVEYSTSPALENLITANVRLDVLTVPVGATTGGRTWTFTANGPGFHATDALKMAEERLIKQISNDATMSLTLNQY